MALILVVHGIGTHTEKSIEDTVKEAGDICIKRYGVEGEYAKHVRVVGIGYDEVFEEERKLIAKNRDNFFDLLKKTGLQIPGMLKWLKKIDDDNWFTTHGLDILLYAGLHSELVRYKVARKMADAIEKAKSDGVHESGMKGVHIVAHSMGTAVVHDTLRKMYGSGVCDPEERGRTYSLDPSDDKIATLWMFANTTPLFHYFGEHVDGMTSTTDPLKSIVRPGRGKKGCVSRFYDISHEYDYVSRWIRLNPPESWLPQQSQLYEFRSIETGDFYEELDPHSLKEYICNPELSYLFLARTMDAGDFNVSPINAEKTDESLKALFKGVDQLVDELGDIEKPKGALDWFKLLQEYGEYVKGFDAGNPKPKN
ncbi:hypothetical protein [Vibrio diabolicus]|uniref:hypothetical protein n=1 Tax=Vibrio diabolicus TaxID=50719 RepID=UPI003B58C088